MATEDYAFTIKKLGAVKDAVPSDYLEIFEHYHNIGCFVHCYVFEEDSHGKCHTHGIIAIPIKLYRKKLITQHYSTKLERIYNRGGWLRYISKVSKHQKYTMHFNDPRTLQNSDHESDEEIDFQDCLPIPRKKLF